MYPQQVRCFQNRNLTVTGEGSVSVAPNVADVRLEVSTENQTVSAAQQENTKIMNQVLSALKRAGIPQEQIQTVSYTIVPQYDYVEGVQVFRGYEVTHAIQVKISELARVGEILDLAVQNGVNRVSEIRFRVENEERFYRQALNFAIQDARSKAKTLGEAMGVVVNLIPFKVIEENIPQAFPFQAATIAERSTAVPIEPGQLKVTATVRAQFLY